jgi:hypothetical protein
VEGKFSDCLNCVRPSYLAHTDTPAAHVARAEPLVCGPDPGPRCSRKEALRIVHVIETANRRLALGTGKG